MLADDYIISERGDATRELGKVNKVNDGKPIFDDSWWPGSVLHDGGRFRMWYLPRKQGFRLADEGKWVGAYAESDDGLNWTRKGLVEGLPTLYSPVYVDPHETDPAHRYKTAQRLNPKPPATHPIPLVLGYSAGGLNWKLYNDGRPVTGPSGDFTNQVLWDEKANLYRLFQRDIDAVGGNSRGGRMLINPDIKSDPTNWTAVHSWKLNRLGRDDYSRRQIYHMNDWLYEGVHFGLLAVYEWIGDLSEGPYTFEKRHERDIVNFYIAPSRDAAEWDFDWVYLEKPMITRGPSGSYDQDAVYPCPTVVTYKDKHWFYYSGGRERHNSFAHFYEKGRKERYPGAIEEHSKKVAEQYGTSLATLRLDGMVCLAAKGEPCTVITKPFRLDGNRVAVNVDARNGSFRMEVLDPPHLGVPIPGFSHTETVHYRDIDDLRLNPRWKEHVNLAKLKGRIVRLKFYLENAKLYSFQVEP